VRIKDGIPLWRARYTPISIGALSDATAVGVGAGSGDTASGASAGCET
jgi:hypothetical protein